jgi:predicted acylesterase/phospholipase RssA
VSTATASAGPGDHVDLDREATSLPTGADARALPQCDLVMKGGITSGVVYPGAVIALAKKFRFAALGGTSAGAIAAGVCAAGEYGRIHGTDEATGLTQLRVVSNELGEPGALTGLFQATDDAKPLMDLALLPADHPDDSQWRRIARLAWAALRRAPRVWLAGAVLVAVFAALVVGAFQGMSPVLAIVLTVLAGIPFLALVSMAMVAAAFGLPARRALRSLPESHYGMCPGTHQSGYAKKQEALTPWLHGHIQAAAGRDPNGAAQVLTVADLQGTDESTAIGFETMTTDLSRARPLRCPADLAAYSFKESEMRDLFPDPVVERMVEDAPKDHAKSNEYLPINAKRLPVLVAIRLSLSFPGLLSAVPLYQEVGGTYRRSLFSDGGIASNFPVHFFDAWFPRRPTFGIDLGPRPEKSAPLVVMHGQDGLGGYREVNRLTVFGGQIKDTMQNWRDNLQTELPGYRERVCEVRFEKDEGGLNLKMAPPKVQALMDRGFEAGEKLSGALPMTVRPAAPSPEWLNHCKVRFDTLMWLQQEGLGKFHERSEVFLKALEAGGLTPPDRRTWAVAAVTQTKELLDCAERWGPAPKDVDFTPNPPFEPEPVMRVVPKA